VNDARNVKVPITLPLVLPSDVVIVPVKTLPEALKQQVAHKEGDHAVTRPGARAPSTIVDQDCALLLQQFRHPRTVIEAVINYARFEKRDAHEILEMAYPMLRRFISSQLLAVAGSPAAEMIGQSLAHGDQVEGLSIVQCRQILDDSELYEARRMDGASVALKIARHSDNRDIRRMMHNEVEILEHLGGFPGPALLAHGYHQDRPYLATEWLRGVDSETYGAECRQIGAPEGASALFDLCGRVLDAYANLHATGVIHGDVHPRNVLVLADGSVRIIDFGLSCMKGPQDPAVSTVGRGGVAFFFEPELAAARLAGSVVPTASAVGEQYALGALVYFLLTGSHYVNFSLEKQKLLQQIATDQMVPLATHLEGRWSGVDEVLRRALEKLPEHRYPSISSFASAFRVAGAEAIPANIATRRRISAITSSPATRFVQDIIARISLNGPLFGPRALQPPTCSVTYGAAGIAFAAYRLAVIGQDPALLALADAWAVRAAADQHSPEAFTNSAMDISWERVGSVSPYHTSSGTHGVQAIVSYAMGDDLTLEQAIGKFLVAVSKPCIEVELALGRSGVLLMASSLLEIAPWHKGLLTFSRMLFVDIWKTVESLGGIRDGGLPYLGVAHGWAGVLYATLRWCRASAESPPNSLSERLDQLAELALHHGRGLRWPISHRPNSRHPQESMAGWCHGSAGYVHLWTEAARCFDNDYWVDLAEQAAWNTWEEPGAVASLCCGLAGRAYGLLNYYRFTNELAWARRAERLGAAAATTPRSADTPRDSLYKGDVGIAVLLAELADPTHSAMPIFESEAV
jgi:serine/threonine-protein kinase